MQLQVNITTQVNSKKIRRVQHNGGEHLVLPSYTLPSNVIMNGILYTADQIDAPSPRKRKSKPEAMPGQRSDRGA